MAQKILTVLTDDIDGKELDNNDAETVTFALDGQTYEIDLSTKNAEKMRKAISTYIENGRKVSSRNKAGRPKRTQMGPTAQEIRDWARSSGYEVPDRGRIPADIREAFEAAR